MKRFGGVQGFLDLSPVPCLIVLEMRLRGLSRVCASEDGLWWPLGASPSEWVLRCASEGGSSLAWALWSALRAEGWCGLHGPAVPVVPVGVLECLARVGDHGSWVLD